MTVSIALMGMLAMMAMGAHVLVSMGLISSAMVVSLQDVPAAVIAQTAFKSVNSYPLMAIPMFVLMGNLMMRGQIASVMIELVGSLVRWVRGGLALTVMLTCVFFAAISGSSVASAAAIGGATVEGLKRENYPPRFSAALVAVGATLGLMIPPSLTFILIGSIVALPVDQLFIAGILPGLMEAALLLFTTYRYACKHGFGHTAERADLQGFKRRLPKAAGALSMPVLVLGSIYAGLFTPTEVSAIAAAYAAILCVFVYRTLDWGGVWRSAQDSLLQSTMIFAVVLGGGLIGFVLARMGVSASLISTVSSMQLATWQFLVLALVILLILGMFLDGVAMIVLTAPLLFPMAIHHGVNPIHFAVVMTATVEIATLTPPVGLNLFVMSGIAKLPVEEVARGVVPFYFTRLAALVIITFVPSLSLLLVQ